MIPLGFFVMTGLCAFLAIHVARTLTGRVSFAAAGACMFIAGLYA